MRFYCDTPDTDIEEVKKFQRELQEMIDNHKFYMAKLSLYIMHIKVPDNLKFFKGQIEYSVSSLEHYYEKLFSLTKDSGDYLNDILNEIKELKNEIEQSA